MTRKTLLLTMLALSVAIAGCGRSQQGAPRQEDMSGLCPAIQHTGLTKQCAVSGFDSAVHVMIANDDDEVARNVCAEVVNRIAQQAARLPAQWMLQVYSPYRSDKPLATCPLH
ncbi:MAG: hypothetical protein LJE57_05785 [Gallionella sp.]|nr:hypothetical protein [Gallionella sp.]